jgi:hypothetical protein
LYFSFYNEFHSVFIGKFGYSWSKYDLFNVGKKNEAHIPPEGQVPENWCDIKSLKILYIELYSGIPLFTSIVRLQQEYSRCLQFGKKFQYRVDEGFVVKKPILLIPGLCYSQIGIVRERKKKKGRILETYIDVQ